MNMWCHERTITTNNAITSTKLSEHSKIPTSCLVRVSAILPALLLICFAAVSLSIDVFGDAKKKN